ncbi:MAG TPA: hypothetical protein VJY39_18175 [Acidisphaera sp.]|nr:hypothetical protein [Acidisphaera sp.]
MDVVRLDRSALILSANPGFWGEVPARLRGVQVRQTGAVIELQCFFDGTPGTGDIETVSIIAGRLAADFPGFGVEEHAERLDAPWPLPNLPNSFIIYRRKEP